MTTILVQDLMYKIYLRSPTNLFDEFVSECQKWYESPAHTLTEMRMRNNNKLKGDIFEEYSLLYLKYVKGYKNVWLLKDVPDDILAKLTMQRRDMGIDLIVETNDDKYIAVQCKYKKHLSTKQNILSWKALSTFYALCLRTGPWDKYIVMTNCIYTRHQGKKTKQDVSYCLKTLQNVSKEEWLRMCNIQGTKVGSSNELQTTTELHTTPELQTTTEIPIINKPPSKRVTKNKVLTKEELRDLRSSYYSQIMN
jgi:hypothetical protein